MESLGEGGSSHAHYKICGNNQRPVELQPDDMENVCVC